MVALPLNLVLIPAMLILLGFLMRQLAVKAVPIGFLRLWLYPGVAVHEVSHFVGCLPAGAKPKSLTIFRADGSGEVQHEPPALGYLGQVIISLAPLAGGIVVLWLVNRLLDSPFKLEGISGDAAQSYDFGWLLLKVTVEDVKNTFDPVVWTHWQTYVMAIAAFSVTLTMIPSGQDLKMAAAGVGLVLLLVILWLLAANYVFHMAGGGVVAEWATYLLGFAHVVLFWFVVDLVLLGVLAGIGRVFAGGGSGGGGGGKSAEGGKGGAAPAKKSGKGK